MRYYYSVITKQFKGDQWSIEFGDYDKECAIEEMEYLKDSGQYHQIKIIRTGDNQASIDAEVRRLNHWFIKG